MTEKGEKRGAGNAGAKRAAGGRKPAQGRSASQSRPSTIVPRRKGNEMFMERPKTAGKAAPAKHARKKANNAAYLAMSLVLLAGILAMLAVGARQVRAHERFLQMKQAVERQSFYAGTTVEGMDVSGMTLNEALAYWRDYVEPGYAQRTVTLDNGDRLTAWDLGYSSDYESVLSNAWSAGRSGSLEERYLKIAQRGASPVAYAVTRVPYRESAVDAYVSSAAAGIDQPAKDAGIASFDPDHFKYEISPSSPGSQLDAEALKRSIVQALDTGGGSVSLVVHAVQPQITEADVSSTYGLITTAITNASTSSRARLANIKLAMSFIHGTKVGPGETFSFNDTVGQRTVSRGFQVATAYSGGEVTEQVGGGICQVSTTLFNAAVKADLEIVERHNHSLTVGYVDKGKDATVDWGNQDLRFKNNSGDDIYICCYLTKDERVRFGIFGRLLPNGESITVETRTVDTQKYETTYQPTALLLPGQTYVAKKGRDGFVAEAYKVRWDANGNQISREFLCRSAYKKVNQVVLYGQ